MATNEELIKLMCNDIFEKFWQYEDIFHKSDYYDYENNLTFFERVFILLHCFVNGLSKFNKRVVNFHLNNYSHMKIIYSLKQKCILLILQDRGVL
jgi:hypothetical protein